MNEKVRTAMCWLRRTHAAVVRKARVGRVKDARNDKWRLGGSDENGMLVNVPNAKPFRYSAMRVSTHDCPITRRYWRTCSSGPQSLRISPWRPHKFSAKVSLEKRG